ncbi:MAG: succinate dehydrogenase, hydrophobic membrane anchor protein [Hyphomicrobium zavarzinii]|uniref:succinate dehydrogenase, hydrophobic membrane anchor protein n=1 Tax=Hyphomicrobium zavarzinii TaxID=48292 RepID=UPI0003804FE3|nr:succinate dehydrogenase, hydrophobic membrane anchor protein [Hyphomicrobium zavarzinii]MBL8844928.1 succinate dehydrogenase, hydrophobic membrane anchor protein [Hyphomicrobium zavarzinii]HML43295.1 succinate dehydrogenase, hydrophobic membrane anchor protein [Hyphomicrobium zavarzinii]
MSMRTPLKEVRRLGSAKEGADHFWTQRTTGAANLVLSIFAIWLAVSLIGADHATVKATIAQPIIALPLLLFVTSAAIHMRLGMQVIIEDYVHGEAAKIVLLMLNSFFAIAVAAASALSILKLSFGG